MPLTGSSGSGFTSVTEAGARLTSVEAGNTAACQRLGQVEAHPPYMLPTDAPNTLRNRAADLGADTIVYTNLLVGTAKADAFRCGAR
ncbi:hypothetical protein [Roseomonas sp. KE2513]|uniref:hypothetical protein n=1 Tax=Roseomonas sp. KE2513 TaxID=2479202 RepID=UPI0018E00EA9|nr:hypothetical protein [Roseomonas sp. KE2513]